MSFDVSSSLGQKRHGSDGEEDRRHAEKMNKAHRKQRRRQVARDSNPD
jgi:hypothetical protein